LDANDRRGDDTARAGLKRLRLPRSPQEQAELERLAMQGPLPVYTWIYGPESFYAGKVRGRSWKDLGVADPVAGCRKLVESLRQMQSATEDAEGAPETKAVADDDEWSEENQIRKAMEIAKRGRII
jgi:hypothetical protein